MKTSRHIHYTQNKDSCVRLELNFEPPIEGEATLGQIKNLYPDDVLAGKGCSHYPVKTAKVINTAGILHLREIMNPGDVLSFELAPGYRMEKMVIDDTASLQIYVGNNGLLYLVSIGNKGVVEVTGQVVQDTDGVYRDLKANLQDTALRKYFVKLTLGDISATQKKGKVAKKYLSHDEAAELFGISPTTLYGIKDIKRVKHNKYRIEDVDKYMEGGKKNGKGRG